MRLKALTVIARLLGLGVRGVVLEHRGTHKLAAVTFGVSEDALRSLGAHLLYDAMERSLAKLAVEALAEGCQGSEDELVPVEGEKVH